MKKILLLVFGLLMYTDMQAQEFETATEAVKNMGLGWNLGNTLDAYSQDVLDPSKDEFWGQQGLESENDWGQPNTTRELIHMMKEAGFGAIRVPVTWFNHMDSETSAIDEAWMKRVHEIVDYVIDEGLYCIINVHHDTGSDLNDEGKQTRYHWIKADEDNYLKHGLRFIGLWAQIAAEFRNYDEKLLFESYNEMLDPLSSWCFASFNAPGQYNAEVAASAYKGLNSYADAFIQTVRATGGNNATRNLIVNTYCAGNGSGGWNSHLTDVLTQLEVTDQVEGHLAFEVHAYPTLANGKKEVDDIISKVNTHLAPKGPIIIGEWGTSNVDKSPNDYDNEPQKFLEFCEYFVEQAKQNNIATFYWMGLSDGFYRSYPAFNQPAIAETIAKAYHGDDFVGKYPTREASDETVVFEGEKMLEWGTAVSLVKEVFDGLDNSTYVEVTYSQETSELSATEAYDMMQFWYNDWSEQINFVVDGKEYVNNFEPSKHYGTPESGTVHTTAFAFDEATFNAFKQKGMLFQGHGVKVTKVVLTKTPSTGIATIVSDTKEAQGDIYNLAGQRVSSPSKGIYIQNGKKYIVR